jgi:hypothetical protein
LADSLLDLLEAALDACPDLYPLFGRQLFDIERLASLDANLREMAFAYLSFVLSLSPPTGAAAVELPLRAGFAPAIALSIFGHAISGAGAGAGLF